MIECCGCYGNNMFYICTRQHFFICRHKKGTTIGRFILNLINKNNQYISVYTKKDLIYLLTVIVFYLEWIIFINIEKKAFSFICLSV